MPEKEAMSWLLMVAVVGGLVLASLLGAVWVFGGEDVGFVPMGEEMTEDSTGATISTDDIGNVNYANLSNELEGLSSVDLEETGDEEGDAAIEGLSEDAREAAEEGVRDGIRLAEERGVTVTEDREKAAINGSVRAAAENEDATPDAIRAAAKGASHGTLIHQGGDQEQAVAADINITQIRASVYGSSAGALSQQQDANETQLQSASYGAAHGTTARYQDANVTQMQHAAVGASAGATHGAVQIQRTDVTQIQEAAQGGSYGALMQRQTANATQIQAAAFGAAGGAAEMIADQKKDPKKVQEAAMGAAKGSLVQGQGASVGQIQAAARGACKGALVQEQHVSVTQILQVTKGATQGAISQHQVADVRQIQAAATGGANGALTEAQRGDVIQAQHAATGAAKGAASAASQYQITDAELIQAAAAGAGQGSVIQIQQVYIQQIQGIAEGAATGALSQHQQASVVQIQSAARGASEGALSQTQVQVINIQQIQIISERAAADTVQIAVEIDINVEQTIYKYAKGLGIETDPDPEFRSLFFDIDDQMLFFANPNEVAVTVTVTSEDGDVETITLSPGESDVRQFAPGVYTLTAETEDGRTVKISGREIINVNLGPDLQSLTATVEAQTLRIENPNDNHVTVTVQEDGVHVLTFDVSPTVDRALQLDPGEYTLTAQIDETSVPVNGEDRYEFTIDAPEINLDVTVDEQTVIIENPSETAVSVRAIDDETGDEQEITVLGETTESQSLEPGDYTLTGEADDRAVLLNGQERLPITISQPVAAFSVQIANVTDSVEGGEEISVTAEITNDGDGEGEEEIVLDIDDREALDSVAVTLGPGEIETVTLTYQTTEDDVGERNVTMRSPSDTAVVTVEVLEGADEGIDQQGLDSCTVITESGGYELVDNIVGEAADFADESGNACLRITASDVVLDGNNNAIAGAGEEETIGVLVAGTEDAAAENVTVRNLRAESWDTGIQIGIEYDNRGDARLEDVTATENEGSGIYVEDSDGVDIESAEAYRNGGSGIGTGEEGDLDSLVDVTANENDVAGVALDHTSDLVAEDITVSENGGYGLLLGRRVYTSEFTDITAMNNDGDGLHLDTDVNSNEFSGIISSGNTRHGIYLGVAGGNVFYDSLIEGNGDVGVRHVEDGSEYVNVTVRDNEEWQVETNGWAPFTASELGIGDTAEFVIDAESVSLDDVDRDDLVELPENAQAVGDGVEIERIEDGVDVILEYDEDENDGQTELWRYDGDEWTSEETVDEADGSIDSTLSEDGIYAPILVDEGDEDQVINSCTVIAEPGVYELEGDVEGEVAEFDDGSDACLRITASDVVLDGNDNAIVGAGEEESTGVLVAGDGDSPAESVTIQNLRAESWYTGIQIGAEQNPGEARLEDLTVSENENRGVYVLYSGSADFATVEANQNGRSGISVGEGNVDSMVDVTANENAGDGIAMSQPSDVDAESITVSGNGGNGLHLDWRVYRSTFTDVTATNNGGHGLSLDQDVDSNEFSDIHSTGNAESGIYMGIANNNVISDSTFEDNGETGISYFESYGNEFLDVTVRDNEDRQVDAEVEWSSLTAAELRIGESTEFEFDEEPVSLDGVEQDELAELPEDAQAVGDAVEVEGIEDSVTVTLEYDNDIDEGQIELWRYDGDEWSVEETVGEADGSIESTLTEDGIYAPILVAEDEPEIDLAVTVDEQDVVIENQHDTAVTVTATDDETDEEQSIEIAAEETVTEEFEPSDYTLSGDAEDGGPVTLNGEDELTISVIAPDPPEFTVSNLDPQNATITEGDEIGVSATIENVGEATGTQIVEFRIDGDVVVDEELELDGGESDTVSFEGIETEDLDSGEYEHGIFTENDSGTGTLTVEAVESEPEEESESEPND